MNIIQFKKRVGYKNAPNIVPKIGDRVACGPNGNSEIVYKISSEDEISNNLLINCAFNGKLFLNKPEDAILIESVDGYIPNKAPE